MVAPEVNRPAAPGVAPVPPVVPEPRIGERERRRQPRPDDRRRQPAAADDARRDDHRGGQPHIDEYA